MHLHFKVTFAQNNDPIGRKTGERRNRTGAFAFAFWRLLSKKPEKTFSLFTGFFFKTGTRFLATCSSTALVKMYLKSLYNRK